MASQSNTRKVFGLSRNSAFSGTGTCRRGANHFIGDYKGGAGDTGDNKNRITKIHYDPVVAGSITMRFTCYLKLWWDISNAAPSGPAEVMGGIGSIWLQKRYIDINGNFVPALETNTDLRNGLRGWGTIGTFGVFPFYVDGERGGVRVVTGGWKPTQAWTYVVMAGVYGFDAAGDDGNSIRAAQYDNMGGAAGGGLPTSDAPSMNIVTDFGLTLADVRQPAYTAPPAGNIYSDMWFSDFSMKPAKDTTPWNFDITVHDFVATIENRASNASDYAWVAAQALAEP